MRVLHVIETMGMGGAERHLANVLAPLSDLGVDNQLVTLWPGDAFGDAVRPFARWHALGLPPRKVLPALPRLVGLARTVDLVHTQLPWADVAGRLAALAARKPSATTLQTTWYDAANVRSFPPPVRRRIELVKRLDALTARTTRRFFAVSEATRQTYVRELGVPARKIDVIPNTVDLAQFDGARLGSRNEARAQLGMKPDELALVMVARLVAPKGHADAIRAVAALAPSLPLRLYIAGNGPEEERLRALIAELGAPAVLLGPCGDVPRLLHASDIFVFPSVVEGLPLALIEAMAMGMACLCSNIPENVETGGDDVAYAPAGDAAKLAEALRALAGDPERRRRLGEGARRRAQRFSSRTVAAELLRGLEEVLSAARARKHVVAV